MKILGLIDVLSSLLFFLIAFGVILPFWLLIVFGSYLILKGLIFIILSKDVGSLLDIAAGGIFIGSHYSSFSLLIFIIFGLIFLIKGGLSLS